MRDNPGGELDPAIDVRRRCKNSFVLSCIGKPKKDGCNRGSEVGTVHSGRGPVPLRKQKDRFGKKRIVRDFVSR